MKILYVKRHGHKVIGVEGAQRKGVFSQSLHVTADRFAKDSESTQSREESQKRYDERAGR
jgi:hypothetical protein